MTRPTNEGHTMRAALGAVLVLLLAGLAAGQEKKDEKKDDPKKDEKFDAKKLVGRWQPADAPKGATLTIEFADKGKLSLSVEFMGKTEKIDGTYKLEGDKLELMFAGGGMDAKETITLATLTDDEMSGKDSKGKEEKFKRVKGKS